MKRKSTIIVTEQQLKNLVFKNLADNPEKFVNYFFKDLFKKPEEDNSEDKDEKSSEKEDSGYPTAGEFLELDLSKPKDFKIYTEIADKFIASRSANLLGIRGSMLANAARNSFNQFGKYVPVELALAQLAQEGGLKQKIHLMLEILIQVRMSLITPFRVEYKPIMTLSPRIT